MCNLSCRITLPASDREKNPQNKQEEYQNMHFGNWLVESQTKSSADLFLKTPRQSGKHACPWCSCGFVDSDLCRQ